jgi:prepilin-type N-terminal cleavage/methylation domain-containing protein/prepilin-type processing-associated H-X9-DG protein
MSRKAFTLIELLVVIAIIAILAAILFPVFAQAKLAAKKISSLSNVKQLDLGILMYSNDVDDRLPMGAGADWWYPSDGGWSWDVEPYLKSLPIMQDGADDHSKEFFPTWMGAPAVEISYATNGFIVYDNEAGINRNRGVIGDAQGKDITRTRNGPYSGWLDVSTITNTQVTQPAATIMLASRYHGQDEYGPGDFMAGTFWDGTCPGALPDPTRVANVPYTVTDTERAGTILINADQRNGAVACPFAGQGNFSFVDGHAKSMIPYATRPQKTTDPGNPAAVSQSDMWDALR